MGGHGVFVGSGGGMPPPRGMHQPGMHPVNPSQGLRAQVPHQFLSAQVRSLLCLMLLAMMKVAFRRDLHASKSVVYSCIMFNTDCCP